MTEIYRFFDLSTYTEAEFAEYMSRMARPDGVLPDSGGGLLAVSAPGGMTVNVADGEAAVRGFWYRNSSALGVSIGSNSSGSTRIDTIVLRLDRTANTLTIQKLVGTPGAGAPALTQVVGGTWEQPLANVSVANGAVGIVAGNITDRRVISAMFTNAGYIGSNVSYYGFLDAVFATAVALKAGSLVASSSFADNAPTNGIFSLGQLQMGGNSAIIPAPVTGTPTQHGIFRESIVKAWGSYALGSGILFGFNTASASQAGANTTINWTRAFGNANYVVIAIPYNTAHNPIIASRAAGSCVINMGGSGGLGGDFDFIAIGTQ